MAGRREADQSVDTQDEPEPDCGRCSAPTYTNAAHAAGGWIVGSHHHSWRKKGRRKTSLSWSQHHRETGWSKEVGFDFDFDFDSDQSESPMILNHDYDDRSVTNWDGHYNTNINAVSSSSLESLSCSKSTPTSLRHVDENENSNLSSNPNSLFGDNPNFNFKVNKSSSSDSFSIGKMSSSVLPSSQHPENCNSSGKRNGNAFFSFSNYRTLSLWTVAALLLLIQVSFRKLIIKYPK